MRQTGGSAESVSLSSPQQRGQACERCWKRKQKCDRLIPTCTTCTGVGVECIPRKFAIGPMTNSGGNLSHAAVPSYVETLKRKRDDLESELRRQRARLEVNAPTTQQQAQTSAVDRNTPQDEENQTRQHIAENTVQAAMGEIGLLSRGAMAEPRDEMSGFSQELAMGRMVRATVAISGKDPTRSTMDRSRGYLSVVDQANALTRDFAIPYVTCFLERVEPHFLYIGSKEMWKDVEGYFESQSDVTEQFSEGSRMRKFNTYMAIATGMLLSTESVSLHGFAGSMHTAAMKVFAEILESGSSVNILHCMLSLIIYSMQSSLGGSTWHLLGLAMQKAIAFGFHKDPSHEIGLTAAQIRDRRDGFWSLYIVDRTISTIMDRPFNIEDDDITVLSPNQYLSCSPAMDVIACRTIDHAKLLSSIRDCDSQGILFHYSNFCCWKDSTAKNGDIGNPSQWILQLECRAMVEILKLRGSATIDEFMISNARAIEKDFVETGIKYLEETYQTFDRGDFRGSFVDAYDVFATGIAVLCLSRRSSRPMHGAGIIHKCTNILTLVAAEFPSLKAFHRVLWALSSVTPGNQIDDPILQNLPTVIPEGIQGLIKEFLS